MFLVMIVMWHGDVMHSPLDLQ